eukprot:1939221-Alexandrium_andersonii.AAC.1
MLIDAVVPRGRILSVLFELGTFACAQPQTAIGHKRRAPDASSEGTLAELQHVRASFSSGSPLHLSVTPC